MLRVLFICIHNSARSQMAEELLRRKSNGTVFTDSAGIAPGKLNPVVIDVLKAIGIDISHKKTKSMNSLLRRKEVYDYVITVCDEASGQSCPIFPGTAKRLHWNIPDPSAFQGTYAEKYNQTRSVMKMIEKEVDNLLSDILAG